MRNKCHTVCWHCSSFLIICVWLDNQSLSFQQYCGMHEKRLVSGNVCLLCFHVHVAKYFTLSVWIRVCENKNIDLFFVKSTKTSSVHLTNDSSLTVSNEWKFFFYWNMATVPFKISVHFFFFKTLVLVWPHFQNSEIHQKWQVTQKTTPYFVINCLVCLSWSKRREKALYSYSNCSQLINGSCVSWGWVNCALRRNCGVIVQQRLPQKSGIKLKIRKSSMGILLH